MNSKDLRAALARFRQKQAARVEALQDAELDLEILADEVTAAADRLETLEAMVELQKAQIREVEAQARLARDAWIMGIHERVNWLQELDDIAGLSAGIAPGRIRAWAQELEAETAADRDALPATPAVWRVSTVRQHLADLRRILNVHNMAAEPAKVREAQAWLERVSRAAGWFYQEEDPGPHPANAGPSGPGGQNGQ